MSNTNAKQEFLNFVKGGGKVLCAYVNSVSYDLYRKTGELPRNAIILPIDYTEDMWNTFLEKLNFTYYSGYGGQELEGVIWFKSGAWGERGEYDGSEWWEYKELPTIPKELLPKQPKKDTIN